MFPDSTATDHIRVTGTTHWQTSGQLSVLLWYWGTWHCWPSPLWNKNLVWDSLSSYSKRPLDLSLLQALLYVLANIGVSQSSASVLFPFPNLFYQVSMTLKYILPAQNSFFSLIHMFVCLLNVSCVSERYHKFNMAQSGGDSTHLRGPITLRSSPGDQ